MSALGRGAHNAGLGVWRFLVGDTPEFLASVLVLVGFALTFRHLRVAVDVGLPLLVLVVLCASLWRAQRRLVAPAKAVGGANDSDGCAAGDSNPETGD